MLPLFFVIPSHYYYQNHGHVAINGRCRYICNTVLDRRIE